MWEVGQRVSFRREHAWVFHGLWGERLSIPRKGTIVTVPPATRSRGGGTVRVEWDSLTGGKTNPDDWTLWVHSSFLKEAK